eukprot:EC784542.1.p4 GENE.EC784542.1~~EC784542.1.p4  ORF type:complete len:57 (+),score=15.99 EC784542.1:97-267(+)
MGSGGGGGGYHAPPPPPVVHTISPHITVAGQNIHTTVHEMREEMPDEAVGGEHGGL